MGTANDINIQQLSQSERILLAEELWDSVAKNQDNLKVTDAQKKILDERMATYKTSPNEGTPWEDVRNEMK